MAPIASTTVTVVKDTYFVTRSAASAAGGSIAGDVRAAEFKFQKIAKNVMTKQIADL
jgi:hypothetical protein